ncbi:hypothetical protein K440DRAFT_646552 [Wilcoxina mikolae CBS 423.85]|nr:hypothetical protein K440DRAFT_646552 [Wilcoxina mikolae CBS 423.85]
MDLNTPTPTTSIANHLKTHISNSSFSFLSYLPPSRVPFFLAAGPSLHVTTTSPETCDFFRRFFLSALPKASDVDEETTEQSRIALLLRVHPKTSGSFDESNPGDWGITEVLIYGAITYPPPPDATQTPPNSSPDPPVPEPVPIVSVRALPLSSRHNFTAHIPVKQEPNQEEARYIAPNPQEILNPIISRSTKKRRADALDRAVDKKIKKQKSCDILPSALSLMGRSALGGRNVNAGNILPPRDDLPDRTGSPEPLVGKKRRSSGIIGTSDAQTSKPHRRTTSMSIMSDRTSSALIPRPRSAAGKVADRQLIKKEPSSDAIERSEIETKNRDLLNKIVLEEMKYRGLKDYRKDRAKSIMPPGEDMLEIAIADEEREQWKKWEEDREEYKGVFHHTVKAAIFALRHNGFGETAVLAGQMRRTVDRLLSVFLDDGKENAVDVARLAIEG